MKKLTTGDKKHIIRRLFELLIETGYSLDEYIFVPASKINFKHVLILIDELETEADYEEDRKFLFDNPQYSYILKQYL